jgi:spermidine synthase
VNAGVFVRAVPQRPLFTVTTFLGSFLLFLIQPMLARMALPVLGGAPAVWTVALAFYQAMLLAGYFYAHHLSRLTPRYQTAVHLALFAAGAATLPIGLAAIDGAGWPPALHLLVLLAVSIGPVFFVVAAQAPLLQAWFARTGDIAAADPYFLYAASNAGSLLALIAYPFVVEPTLRLAEQARLWSAAFVLLAALVALCGLQSARGGKRNGPEAPPPVLDAAATMTVPGWSARFHWAALAAVPSGLLLSTTTHLTTDIVAVPLLWVIPLALYLATFILAFSEGGAIFVRQAKMAAPLLLLLLGGYTFLASGLVALLMAVTNLALLFVVALALHGTLAERRPPAAQLTDFYLWMSLGGVAGGLFGAIVAPLVFDWVYEHPILLVAAAALVPAMPLTRLIARLWSGTRARWLAIALPALALAASWWVHNELIVANQPRTALPGLMLIALASVLSIGRRLPFALCFAALLLALGGWRTIAISGIEAARTRSFFGVYTVKADTVLMVRQLDHGTTLHGAQSLLPDLMTMPQSYYAPGSGIAVAMQALPTLSGPGTKVGFVGLGAGSLACFAKPDQRWTAFEIDPVVVGIARDARLFTYLDRCAPDLDVVIGDARLAIAREAPASYDLIAIDAFSSDAIPLHLMTREAFAVYQRALKPDGFLVVHISNRHVDLEPPIAAIARDMGWEARVLDHRPADPKLPGISFSRSIWVAMAASEARLQQLVQSGGAGASAWQRLRERPGFAPWTDDFASIVPLLKM